MAAKISRSPRKTPSQTPDGLPTREAILAFMREEAEAGRSAGKREIARAFGVRSEARIGLKKLLKDMEHDGVIDRRGLASQPAGFLPPVVAADVVGRDDDGDLIAEPVEWDPQNGAAPRILIEPVAPRMGEPVPGVGDRVLLRIQAGDDNSRTSGRIIRILPREKSRTLGVIRLAADGRARLIPVDKKAHGRELDIAAADLSEAKDGDLVSVAVTRDGRFGATRARVRERLGSLHTEKAISLIAIYGHNIPHVFSAAAEREAEAVRQATMKDREDWRSLPLVTIDPADAKDHDDAVHAAPDDDPDNPGGFILSIAIADVAAYVRPGSSLDREAVERGNSVYFPDRVVPMLPERISNDLCSLRPHENRPALAVRVKIAADGRKLSHRFHRVMIRSAAKLSYPRAQAAIDGTPDDETAPLRDPVLTPLFAAYAALKIARDARGPLDLDLPERKLVLKPDGALDRVVIPQRLDAHRLIEEFMILANVCAAETLEKEKTPLVYRVHDEPALEKLEALREVLASIAMKLTRQGALSPSIFNRVLGQVRGTPNETFINEVVLRSQAQAEYSPQNYGHFGLNLRRYAHFTSPIRRYADLIVHRALIRALKFGEGGLPAAMDGAALAEISTRISTAERRAMAAERETVDRLIAHHLADRVGAEFEARIAGVTRSGLFVSLAETGASGFIPVATLGNEFFRYDEASHAMTGERSGETYRLGDPARVRLVEAAPVAGALRFEMLSKGKAGEPGRRSSFKERVTRLRGKAGPSGKATRSGKPVFKGRR